MTCKSKVMPDDALTDLLVGEMLQIGQQGEITGDGSAEALPEMDRPLCELMFNAWFASEHYGTSRGMAYVLDVVRDWLFLQTCHTTHALEVRDLLTEQARIARAGHPTGETEGAP